MLEIINNTEFFISAFYILIELSLKINIEGIVIAEEYDTLF